jgi:RNA polymerase sigma factor (sigma-70 family)
MEALALRQEPGLSPVETAELRSIFDDLPPNYRLVLQRIVIEGRSIRAVASELGISRSAVATRLEDAIESLRLRWEWAADRREGM